MSDLLPSYLEVNLQAFKFYGVGVAFGVGRDVGVEVARAVGVGVEVARAVGVGLTVAVGVGARAATCAKPSKAQLKALAESQAPRISSPPVATAKSR
jgi:hypothetical protein